MSAVVRPGIWVEVSRAMDAVTSAGVRPAMPAEPMDWNCVEVMAASAAVVSAPICTELNTRSAPVERPAMLLVFSARSCSVERDADVPSARPASWREPRAAMSAVPRPPMLAVVSVAIWLEVIPGICAEDSAASCWEVNNPKLAPSAPICAVPRPLIWLVLRPVDWVVFRAAIPAVTRPAI